MQHKNSIAVLGAGSWGTALAIHIAKNGHNVYLWGRNSEKLRQMQQDRCNKVFLPEIDFPEQLIAEADLEKTLEKSQKILVVVPSIAFRKTLQTIKRSNAGIDNLCWATKGLEEGSQKLLHQVVAEEFPTITNAAIISGPTFAGEVVRQLPTAVTIASKQNDYAMDWAEILHNETFRPYISDDLIGLEVGGAVKNALAIAAGIADGLGYGANTRAALITRGLAEMNRLALALGAQSKTIMGLSGLGDLLLTATDNQSRNRRFGLGIGQGKTIDDIKSEINQVIEGYQTVQEIYTLSKKLNVSMPIVEQCYLVLYKNKTATEAVRSLLSREFHSE